MTHPGPPKEPFDINGGCFCKAVRYKISVAAFSERAKTPYKTPDVDIGDLRLPMTVICHCGDCRSATSSIIPCGMVTESKTVQLSLISKNTMENNETTHSVPADEIFEVESSKLQYTYLTSFKSSAGRHRWFCSRCGTPIGYSIDQGVVPPEWGWPTMLDLWYGTVDRVDLEKDWMRPERMLWCDKGVDWIRRFARNGAGGVSEHPLTKIDKLCED